MKTSAGARASTCFANALLAPYETTTLLLVLVSKSRDCSSMASLRLAAAKTVTSAASAVGNPTMVNNARRNDPGIERVNRIAAPASTQRQRNILTNIALDKRAILSAVHACQRALSHAIGFPDSNSTGPCCLRHPAMSAHRRASRIEGMSNSLGAPSDQ